MPEAYRYVHVASCGALIASGYMQSSCPAMMV